METYVLGFSELKKVYFTKLLVRMYVDSIWREKHLSILTKFAKNIPTKYRYTRKSLTSSINLKIDYPFSKKTPKKTDFYGLKNFINFLDPK